jgi:DNA mismatch repair ATPase MutL
MKKEEKNMLPEILLTPIICEIIKNIDIEAKIEQLSLIGFDVSKFGDNKLIFYAVPNFLVKYKIDLTKFIDSIIIMEDITLDNMIDKIFATKACKISIKA